MYIRNSTSLNRELLGSGAECFSKFYPRLEGIQGSSSHDGATCGSLRVQYRFQKGSASVNRIISRVKAGLDSAITKCKYLSQRDLTEHT
jgi:hypothetical protein